MMLALAEAFSKVSSSYVEEMEAEALGITLEKYTLWKTGYHDTYTVSKVKTMEYGYKLPNYKRSGWRACGNY
jgi:hypothetical protein